MMSAAQNRRITEGGSGTPFGVLLRRYWQAIALAEELVGPRPVRVLGQDLVLFRDEAGGFAMAAVVYNGRAKLSS